MKKVLLTLAIALVSLVSYGKVKEVNKPKEKVKTFLIEKLDTSKNYNLIIESEKIYVFNNEELKYIINHKNENGGNPLVSIVSIIFGTIGFITILYFLN